MQQRSVLEQRLKGILRAWVDPCLKPLGFRKRAFSYSRPTDEVWWVVNVQRSRWNTHEQCEFTINLGVYVPKVDALAFGRACRHPSIARCTLQTRLGMLPKGIDEWWTIRIDDEHPAQMDSAIGQVLASLLKTHGLPFLQRFQSLRSVLNYLKAPPTRDSRGFVLPVSDGYWSFAYIGILHWLLDERELCCEVMQRAVEEARRSRVEGLTEIAQSLYARLCSENDSEATP